MAEAELTVASERERLARDVHDIMAHSLAIVAAQADGARLSDDDLPERTSSTLTTIAETARSSLGELRLLLESGGDRLETSTSRLEGVGALAERIRRAGHRVDLSVLGEPRPLSPTQDTMLYRIVQESLTNALKHAGSDASTRCSLDWRGPGVALLVETTTPSGARESGGVPLPAPPITRGLGIRGMEERARLAGGWLTAGADPDEADRFVVQAFVPVSEPAAVEASA
ncbi:sensor histidine kinase [Agromyces protaetiae]|uniref:sensor histidine kinase n=1 Tax=Agromyces protaetiae TaxID=2509455 RepID=UPI003C7CC862